MNTALILFKCTLGIESDELNDLYLSELEAAEAELAAAGAALDCNEAADRQLIVDCAVFHHLNADKESGLPRHIVSRVNNRKVRRRAQDA